MTCADALPFVLGEPPTRAERAAVFAHLLRCPGCQWRAMVAFEEWVTGKTLGDLIAVRKKAAAQLDYDLTDPEFVSVVAK